MGVKNKVLFPNLKAEIARNGDTLETLSKLLGVSIGGVSRRLSGETDWNLEEVRLLVERYDKPFEELFIKEL